MSAENPIFNSNESMSNKTELELQLLSNKFIAIMMFKDAYTADPKLLLSKGDKGYSPISERLEMGTTFDVGLQNQCNKLSIGTEQLKELIRTSTNENDTITNNQELWRIYGTDISDDNPLIDNDPNSTWFNQESILRLAELTIKYKTGQISEEEWEANPGLNEKWYSFLQEIGIIYDPTISQSNKLPSYYQGRTPITGRYYGEEYEQTQKAAHNFAQVNIPTYPKHNPDSYRLISESGDVFNFLGGSHLVDPPFKVQLGFFRTMKNSQDVPMTNKTCYVAIKDGYLGRTASLEVAYAMANKKRLIFSEKPTKFSSDASEEIISIVKENHNRYPQLAVDQITNQLDQAKKYQIEHPQLTDDQKKKIFSSVLDLIRDLVKKFGNTV